MDENKKIVEKHINKFFDENSNYLNKISSAKVVNYSYTVDGKVYNQTVKYSEEQKEQIREMLEKSKKIYYGFGDAFPYRKDEGIDEKSSKKKKSRTINKEVKLRENKLIFLFSIIPKSARPDAISDLQELILDMRQSNCSKLYFWFIVCIHIISLVYHGLFFKLKDYFYPTAQQSNKD